MSYLIDSDWLIDATGSIPTAVRTLNHLSGHELAASIISVAEVYEGAFGLPDTEIVLAALRDFFDDFRILPLTDSIAERFARLRASLRRQGRLIPDLDLLIAATALDHNLTLVTRNVRHFERISGLKLYRPT